VFEIKIGSEVVTELMTLFFPRYAAGIDVGNLNKERILRFPPSIFENLIAQSKHVAVFGDTTITAVMVVRESGHGWLCHDCYCEDDDWLREEMRSASAALSKIEGSNREVEVSMNPPPGDWDPQDHPAWAFCDYEQ
jgi:hypothetical protein